MINIPSQYKARIKAGTKLNNSCKQLMMKEGNNHGEQKRDKGRRFIQQL